MLIDTMGNLLRNVGMMLDIAICTRHRPYLAWLRARGRHEEEEALIDHVVSTWSRTAFLRLGCEVRVEGSEHIPTDRGFVVMSNHQSKFDILVLAGFLGKPMGFVAKRELFRIPLLSYWMRQIHCLPLDRKDISGGGAQLQRIGAELKERGRGFVIFPEGTRTRHADGALLPFKQGSVRLASQNALPVLPVVLDGTRFLDRNECIRRTPPEARLVRVRIAPLRPPPGGSAPERKRFMEALRETLVSNREAIRVTWSGC